ncbi:MAG: hypothetical protein GHCLOJNM_02348 [bacterium]|nr:hypothetical protein [bacterium]
MLDCLSSRILKVWAWLPVGILLGCSSAPVQVSRNFSERVQSTPEIEAEREKDAHLAGEPCWRRVVYRGKVCRERDGDGPIPGATVSICEGMELVSSTMTGPDGSFELSCDLYGAPALVEDDREEWRPENYYFIAAAKGTGDPEKQPLSSISWRKPLILALR